MADRSGQQLGNYRLVKLLGQGGFAEVYLGEHLHLGTLAAIKVLYAQLTTLDGEEFRREARMIARLIHPRIIRVLDFGLEGSTPFLVMDYAPNGTLRQRHSRGSRLAVETIVSYVEQIADGLHYAHGQRLIHRDIKPENILIGAQGELLLGDFGIALVAQSSRYQSMQNVAGTMAYSAPEQIQGKPRSASDQYALGIMIYEWLTGERPFQGSFTELVGQHLAATPPPLREKIPALSAELEQVVMTALNKDPRQRFGSVKAFARALEQASQPELCRAEASVEKIAHPQLPTVPAPPVRELATTPYTSEEQKLSPPAAEPLAMQTPPSVMTPPSPTWAKSPRATPAKRVSRRALIIGLLGAGVAAGGVTWWITSPYAPYAPSIRNYSYLGHSGHVASVAWSPNGKRIASGSADNTVQVWDAADGGNAYIYRGHKGTVLSVAWSPDGKHIASGGADKTVRVWNAANGGSAFAYEDSDLVNAVAWSPNGKRIASASNDGTVQVWDAANGGNVYSYGGHGNMVLSVAWSPDGKRIASGSADKTVQVWDAANGGNAYIYRGHENMVWSVAWSPDGQRIASGSADYSVQVWDAADGSNGYFYNRHSNWVNAVAWSPDGKRIASGSADKTVQVWGAVDGSHVYIYGGHNNWVNAVTWSPDGKRIASGSADDTVQVWKVESGS